MLPLQLPAADLAEALINGFTDYCSKSADMSDPSSMPCTLALYDLKALDQLSKPLTKLATAVTKAVSSLGSADAAALTGEPLLFSSA
jgi:hypothetical protein